MCLVFWCGRRANEHVVGIFFPTVGAGGTLVLRGTHVNHLGRRTISASDNIVFKLATKHVYSLPIRTLEPHDTTHQAGTDVYCLRIGALGVRLEGISISSGDPHLFPRVKDAGNGVIEGESTALLRAKGDDRPRFMALREGSSKSELKDGL